MEAETKEKYEKYGTVVKYLKILVPHDDEAVRTVLEIDRAESMIKAAVDQREYFWWMGGQEYFYNLDKFRVLVWQNKFDLKTRV